MARDRQPGDDRSLAGWAKIIERSAAQCNTKAGTLDSGGTYPDDRGNRTVPAVVGAEWATGTPAIDAAVAAGGVRLSYSAQHATSSQDAYADHGVVVLLPKHRDVINPDAIRVIITADVT